MESWFWILGWSLSILTITGNGFIILLVCSKRQLRTKTNAFIVSLAVADFFVGMTVVPSLFFCEITNGCTWSWSYEWLSWAEVLRWLFGYASVTNLCSLVLDRYVAVVMPLRYLTFMTRQRVTQMICLSWVIPVCSEVLLVTSLYLRLVTLENISSWIYMILLELLPCLILVFFVATMVRVAYKQDRTVRILSRQLRFNHHVSVRSHDKNTVITMVIVVGVFLGCYSLFIRATFRGLDDHAEPFDYTEYKIPILVLNSAVNPLTYALLKRDLKKECKRMTLFCKDQA